MIGADALQELTTPGCAKLLAALKDIRDEPPLGLLQRLRANWSPDVVAAAVEVQWARTRAQDKFGARAAELWCDREAVQMASSPASAQWKARRFAKGAPPGAPHIVDLCCGIGGDLMELARVGDASGVEENEARAWMAARNAGVQVEWGDALGAKVDGCLVHADPGRRQGGRRILSTEDLHPPLEALRTTCAHSRGAAIKLGPGMDLLPHEFNARDEIEFICEGETLTQQVLWSGALAHAPGQRTATVLGAHAPLTLTGPPADTPCAERGTFAGMIAVPNPALERARLVHLVADGATEPALGLGILTADTIAPSPWLEVHGVVAQMQARERTVADWLKSHGGGTPIVRTRGKACDPAAWQKELRSPGDAHHYVWILRVGDTRTALVTKPLATLS